MCIPYLMLYFVTTEMSENLEEAQASLLNLKPSYNMSAVKSVKHFQWPY